MSAALETEEYFIELQLDAIDPPWPEAVVEALKDRVVSVDKNSGFWTVVLKVSDLEDAARVLVREKKALYGWIEAEGERRRRAKNIELVEEIDFGTDEVSDLELRGKWVVTKQETIDAMMTASAIYDDLVLNQPRKVMRSLAKHFSGHKRVFADDVKYARLVAMISRKKGTE